MMRTATACCFIVIGVAGAAPFACSRDGGAAPAAPSPAQSALDPNADLVRDLVAKARAQASATPETGAVREHASYLGSFTAADVRAAAREAGWVAGDSARWIVSEWKPRPGSLVVLTFQPIPFGGNLGELHPGVLVLAKSGAKLVAVAQGKLTIGDAHCGNGSGEPASDEFAPSFELDLAPYAIAPGNTAIGVRFVCHTTFLAGEASETHLGLLEIRGRTLREIFREPVVSANHDRPSGMDTAARGVVVMQKTTHGGYFDLIVRTTKTREDVGTEASPTGARGPARQVETRRFVWSSDRYIAAP